MHFTLSELSASAARAYVKVIRIKFLGMGPQNFTPVPFSENTACPLVINRSNSVKNYLDHDFYWKVSTFKH